MKKLKLVMFVVFMINVNLSFAQELQDEILPVSQKLGLVAYLTQVKYISEFQMSKLVNNPQYKLQEIKANEFNVAYNSLKIYIDLMINQMSADLYKKNGLRLYRRADKYIKIRKNFPNKFIQYQDCLKKIEATSSVLGFKDYSSKNGASVAEWIDLGSLALDVYKANIENKQKKVANIIGILNQLRLKDINQLLIKEKDEKL